MSDKKFKTIQEPVTEGLGEALLSGKMAKRQHGVSVSLRLVRAREELAAAVAEAQEVFDTDTKLIPLFINALTVDRSLRGDGLLISGRLVLDPVGDVFLEGQIAEEGQPRVLGVQNTPESRGSPETPETPETPVGDPKKRRGPPPLPSETELRARGKELGVDLKGVRGKRRMLDLIEAHLETQSQITPDSTEVTDTEPPKLPSKQEQAEGFMALVNAEAVGPAISEANANADPSKTEPELLEESPDATPEQEEEPAVEPEAPAKLGLDPEPDTEPVPEPEPEPEPEPPPQKKMVRTSPALSVITKVEPVEDNAEVLSVLGNSAVVTGLDDEDDLAGVFDEDENSAPPSVPSPDDTEPPDHYPPPGSSPPIREVTAKAGDVDVDALLQPEASSKPPQD